MIFFGLRQAVEDCPPILRVLDAKKQIVGTHANTIYRIRMHQKLPFFMKKRPTMAILGQKLGFLGFPLF